MLRDWQVRRLGAGQGVAGVGTEHVVEEAALRLTARGAQVATILRTPGHDLELVRGFLHAEGKLAQVTAIDANTVDIDLPASAFAPRAVASVAGCGVCGRDDIDDLTARAVVVTAAPRDAVTLAGLTTWPHTLRAHQPLFDATGGVHAAALVRLGDGALVLAREDVGRHNAVDKVVGAALAAGVEFAACGLMLSGRLGFELAQKAVLAGVPVVASVSAPSSLALTIAERFGVTAIGFLRDGRATVYTHPARVRG